MTNYKELIANMTLEEKASLMSGENFWNTKQIDRLRIPSIMLTDGPHGLRKQGGKADHLGLNKSIPATCFPTAATLANSWDLDLIQEVGSYLGKEAASEQVSVLLGPGLNIKRNPLCGRNFEYFSEDPYLTGKLAANMVKGIQSHGIAACPKHYAVNSQEHMRMTIDEVVDERALREIYLEGFRYAVEEGKPKTIMTSYNKVNGEYANENHHLMQDILYGEWDFQGVAVTDWGGNNDRVEGLKAGNQLEMPSTGGITDKEIVEAVQTGELQVEVLDEAVERMLQLIFETTNALQNTEKVDYEEHHQKAIEAARKSIVLLKNDKATLPLKKEQKVAIIGDFAENPRYQGAGSSLINPTKLDNALDALQATDLAIIGYEQGFKRFGGKSESLKKRALKLAQEADVVLLFLGLDEGSEAEGIDRADMKLRDNQLELVKELANVHDHIVVVLSGGSAIEMPFAEDVQAIVHGYLGGQGGATAIRDVLLGDYNPSGKLAETYALKYEDIPSAPYYPGLEATSEHRESIYIGYRYFDTKKVPVLFPFGHGLSYTEFAYSDLRVSEQSATFTIRNIGEVAGEEVAQLYIKPTNASVFRANKELKGFIKVHLEPGESKEVKIELDDHAFSYYNSFHHCWSIETGSYEIQVGSSIDDIRLSAVVEVQGDDTEHHYNKEALKPYYQADVHHIGDEAFHQLLGWTPPNPLWDRKAKLGYNDTIAQGKYKKGFGKLLYIVVLLAKKFLFFIRKPLLANNVMFVMNMPFRQIPRFSQGKISEKMVDRVLKLINFW
ncbi:glycoside hydrolase family 3 C-terminal domain-containing protein [Ornithinibacillus sp. BX22]|uniref:Glycoside hydrolase family 3 C-terminal domain-containing protein n=1 Tax=Ornithinibacillus hominis TaxID=2763055 RepID=A0A923RF25_9BACI|nr:glycoside hydrolase family 3 C-terminal domain-containing protein [Ornithinibacillus hominis]MBC5635210.1 glycoside hydrolase family 3 C-terminal domain-containing protein [Ornithinibacillus hominis]